MYFDIQGRTIKEGDVVQVYYQQGNGFEPVDSVSRLFIKFDKPAVKLESGIEAFANQVLLVQDGK